MPFKSKCSLLLALLYLLPFCSRAQHADSMHVFSLLGRAETLFSTGNPDSALFYSGLAEKYSQKHHFKKGIAYALIKKSDILIDADSLTRVQFFVTQTLHLGRQIQDTFITAVATMQAAQIKMYSHHYEKAIPLFEKSIAAYFKRHPSKYAALAYNDLGYTYGSLDKLQEQASCLIKSLEIHDQLKDDDIAEKAVVLDNLAVLYNTLGQKDKAIDYGEQCLALVKRTGNIIKLSQVYGNLSQMYIGSDHKKSARYMHLGTQYAEQSGDEKQMILSYINASLAANRDKDYAKGLGYEKKIIDLLESDGKDPAMLSRRYIAAGFYEEQLHDSTAAISYYQKALHLAKKIDNKTNTRDSYLYLTILYKQHKDFEKAYDNYKKYVVYRDSIVNGHTKASIAEIETKYQTAKKDKEIVQLNADQKIKQLQIEKQDAVIAGNKAEALKKENEIILLSQSKELQQLKIKQQEEQLEKQQLLTKNNKQRLQLAEKEKELQQRQLKNFVIIRNLMLGGVAVLLLLAYFLFNRYKLKRKIKEQEALLEVRSNIAKELHDEVGSALTSIKILSEVSGKHLISNRTGTAQFLRKITEQSAEVQQSMSDIVWSVKPENDKMENLVIRMREYLAHTLELKNISTSLDLGEDIFDLKLNMNQRKDFLMVFKEAVNNIAKHAWASRVQIKLEKQHSQIHLTITDNGRGFDPEQETSSSGLANMKTRAVALHGSIEIASQLNRGSSIDLFFPTT